MGREKDMERYFCLSRTQIMWLLLLLAVAILLPSIGFIDFNTKGEPREVAVVHAMISTGNYVLPVDNAGDIAYKPPMFHWMIAGFAWLFGSLSEFVCRLPSALALIATTLITFLFFSNKRNNDQRAAILIALFTLTSFECFRAGTNCRVDMVLTAFMLGGMTILPKALEEKGWKSFGCYLVAVVCMSGATLTKGPVGIILPLGVWWLYSLLRGYGFIRVTLLSILLAVISLVLPAVYYLAAWHEGGDRFLSLAYEENFGRMLGQMSYGSHENAWWYNFVSLIIGWLPWTVGVIAASIWIWVRKKRFFTDKNSVKKWGRKPFKEMSEEECFSIVAILFILVFYTIPESKRSVYLLPMYPFIAYWIVRFVEWLASRAKVTGTIVRWAMIVVCTLYPIIYGVVLPAVINGKSDRQIAEHLKEKVPSNEVIYTFIPDRFMRYYITDHYLGYRMRPLLPSGQTLPHEGRPDANDIVTPSDSAFYLAVNQDVWEGKKMPLSAKFEKKTDYGLHAWLKANGLSVEELYVSDHKTHDLKSPLVLLKVYRKN